MMHGLQEPRAVATKTLVMANVGIFFAASLLHPGVRDQIDWNFGLSRSGLRAGFYWQLVTHQFLHGSVFHLLVNMLGLWFAGRQVETLLGARRFVFLYLLGGIAGGLAQALLSRGGAPLIGASGSVCAVLLAFTTLVPEAPITALVFFVVPVRLRAKYLGAGLVLVTVFFWLSGIDPGVGHLAHLGGCATGFLFAKLQRYFAHPDPARKWRSLFPPASAPPVAQHFEVVEPERDNVDGILEKVLRSGIQSLSRSERRILEEARARRRNRW